MGVVLQRLPVRPVRHLLHTPVRHLKTGMATAAVAATVFQKIIGGQMGPVGNQGLQILQWTTRPRRHIAR
jgi:hypothetical protein